MKKERVVIAAVSGGADSVYLLHRLVAEKTGRVVAGHVNHGARGGESDKDQEFVERMAKKLGMELRTGKVNVGETGPFRHSAGSKRGGRGGFPSGFEEKARAARYEFLKALAAENGGAQIALAHTADDQVETVLMRVFEGAGIAGLKGIPRDTDDGIVRPILDVWKEDILRYLKERNIPYRTDRSNFDTRFERNWVRNVLLPLLEERYGKSVRKRIHALGERFREIDDYLGAEARKWIRRNVKPGQNAERGGENIVGKTPTITAGYPRRNSGTTSGGILVFPRKSYSRLPAVLRVKILQGICFDRLGLAPNERLLMAMDRAIRERGPSARVKVGNGWELANRYGEAAFLRGDARERGGKGKASGGARGGGAGMVIEPKGKVTPTRAKRLAARGDAEVFDAAGLRLPLSVRPLRKGDRVRPFGLRSEKKVKEILIDRKIPRAERWGRPAVCDAFGTILWIPGVVRSAHAPVTAATRNACLLKVNLPE